MLSSKPWILSRVKSPMRKTTTLLIAFFLMANGLDAQPPFGGGGDRGGRGGPQFGGGGPPFGGGGPGGRGGGDRGSRGFDRGGGGPGGPGGRGGDRGGPGGRGGFDPSSFLDRLDRNQNGTLDADEQEGPASFLIQRLQSVDSSIQPGRPIRLDAIKAAFAKMRGESGGDDRRDGDRDGRDRGSRRSDNPDGDAALEIELLVPGFGVEDMSEPLLGFGAAAELLTSEVQESDRVDAQRRMGYFDKNKDGFLQQSELTSQFAGDPMDFDRNRDGKLSVDELAVRYARRRVGREEAEAERRQEREQPRRDDGGDRGYDPKKRFGDNVSYRRGSRALPEGLPGTFKEKDKNADGQVTMAEFASEWNDDQLKKFAESDFNQDGVITATEAIRALEEGPATGSGSSNGSTLVMAGASPAKGSAPGSTAGAGEIDESMVSEKYLSYARKIIDRKDADKNGSLTPSEWKTMMISPAGADANQDGRITAPEYAYWLANR